MAYIIKQKIKGRLYEYKVEAYWDKEKKQSRQKRTYIGPVEPKNKMYRINKEDQEVGLRVRAKNIVTYLFTLLYQSSKPPSVAKVYYFTRRRLREAI